MSANPKPKHPPATFQAMSSDADMDPEHSTSSRPNNLPCMFAVDSFQEPDSEASYIVRPTAIWNSLQRFKYFQLRDEDYLLHGIVTVSRHDLPQSPLWTATVLEIRGHPKSGHTFLRLYWLYRPSQLPPSLRHPYHGRSELLASNSMAVIDASAVTGRVYVHHWREEREAVPPAGGLFWRQTYDVQTQSLSLLHTPCPPPCIQHHNPDDPLIPCPHPPCTALMHKSCLQAARLRTNTEASASSSTPPRKNKKRKRGKEEEEAAAAASAPPQAPPANDQKSKKKKKKKEKGTDPSSLLKTTDGEPPSAGIAGGKEEKGDGRYWLEDKRCLGCGGSFPGW